MTSSMVFSLYLVSRSKYRENEWECISKGGNWVRNFNNFTFRNGGGIESRLF
jgi:hypothetical protein